MISKKFTTMAMPCTIMVADKKSVKEIEDAVDTVHLLLDTIDEKYSPFKINSLISRLNQKKINKSDLPEEAQKIFHDCEETKKLSDGYFEIQKHDGSVDTCGLVKGWAILKASTQFKALGFRNFMIEIAGDIQTEGSPKPKSKWLIGIRNPFKINEIVKVVALSGKGIATSGTYMQGMHIYNPKKNQPADEIVSLTVIGPDVYEADRFATAAFAMGKSGIKFIENYPSLDGYAIDGSGVATFTSGFLGFVKND